MVDEAAYNLRLALPADAAQIRAAIRRTLTNPEGKSGRKRYDESIERGEVLLIEREEGKGAEPTIIGFIEWHSRIDGSVTIRDFGSTGDEPQPTIIRRLVREMLGMTSAGPGQVHLRLRAGLEPWSTILAETPGFEVGEREFSRGSWWNIWVWSGLPERRPRVLPRRR